MQIRTFSRFIIVFICLSAFASVSQAAETPNRAVSILKKAYYADRLNTYQGITETQTFFCGHNIKGISQVYHQKPDKDRIEYQTAPLRGVIIIESHQTTWRVDPRRKICYQTNIPDKNPAEALENLRTHYQIKLSGKQTIAGRPCIVISLISKKLAIQKKLWVDESTGVRLAQKEFDSKGRCISYSRFKQIQFLQELDNTLFEKPQVPKDKMVVMGEKTGSITRLSQYLGFKILLPSYLPKGYKLKKAFVDRCCCNSEICVAHLRFGDGLHTFSVLEGPSCLHSGNSEKTLDFGSAQVITQTHGKLCISVVGDFPTSELKKIAHSIH